MDLMPSHPNPFAAIDNLITVTGGVGVAGAARIASPSASQQAELRQMAQEHCPVTYSRNRSAATLTRAMGERCLDEAGYGWAKGQLDKYFPPTRR
jgi:hypothetical protein